MANQANGIDVFGLYVLKTLNLKSFSEMHFDSESERTACGGDEW